MCVSVATANTAENGSDVGLRSVERELESDPRGQEKPGKLNSRPKRTRIDCFCPGPN